MAVLPFRLRLRTAAISGLGSSTSVVCPSRQQRDVGSFSCRAAAAAGGPIIVSGDPPTFVSAPGRRIVAVGDLHGDLHQTRAALVIAGVLSAESDCHVWTGGQTEASNFSEKQEMQKVIKIGQGLSGSEKCMINMDSFVVRLQAKPSTTLAYSVLVQVGDILDRGEDEIAILSLLSSLNVQAKSQGGAVFQVNGNHETMNVEGDFRYVDPGSFDECIRFLEYLEKCDGKWDDAFLNWVNVSQRWKEEYRVSPNGDWLPLNFVKKNKGFAARAVLFKQGGPLACELARHPVVLNVNDWIFCHGGLLPHHVEYGIERINKEVSNWMQGSREDSDDMDLPFIATRGYDSVVWTRLYSQDSVERTRRSWDLSSIIAEQTLKSVGAKGMVVGHTPQTRGVNCKCDGKVWCVDVGMSYGVLHSRPEVLEIVNDRPRVLKGQRDSYDDMEVLDYL